MFSCAADVHIAKKKDRNTDSKVKRCIHLEYGNETKGYQLQDQKTKQVLHSRDIVINQQTCGFVEETGTACT